MVIKKNQSIDDFSSITLAEILFEVYSNVKELEILVTPKIHIVLKNFFHIIKKGLGFYSQQAMQSVHHEAELF